MSSKSFALIIFILALLGSIHSGRAQSQTISDKADSAIVTIKLSDIQKEYKRITTETPEMVSTYADSALLSAIEASLLRTSETYDILVGGVDEILSQYLRAWQINNLRNKLNRAKSNFTDLSKKVVNASVDIEASLTKIEKEKARWNSLKDRADPDQILANLLPQIDEVLLVLKSAEEELRRQFTKLLDLHNQINVYQNEISEYLERVNEAESLSFERLFERDTIPFWEQTRSDSLIRNDARSSFSGNLLQGIQESADYLKEKKNTFIGLILFGIVLFSVILYVRRFANEEDAELSSVITKSPIANYPFSASLIISLLTGILILSNKPTLFTEALLLLFSFPIVVYSWNRSVQSRWIYWVIILIYTLDVVLQHIPLSGRGHFAFTILLNAIAVGLLYWMQANKDKYLGSVQSVLTDYIKVFLIPFFFFLSAVSFVLILVGYNSLAKLFLTGIASTLYVGPVILICTEIAISVLSLMSKNTFLKKSKLAERYLPDVIRVVKFAAVFLWFRAVFRGFGMYNAVNSGFQSLWNFGGSFGELTITVGGVIGTIIIIVLSFVISNIIRALLEEEIFSRLNVPRGVPMAIGVLGKYLVITIGFFLAIASVGFDLTKMSIVVGALGVGVGLGLQSLVSNFVSGLILIFERPILVGDIIAAEGVEGTVSEIGIRSSKVRTYAGADVIIPNAILVSSSVSNWTMTDRIRRFTIEIRTHGKGDPEKISEVIKNIAKEHPHVLKSPSSFVVFEGQLDQVLLFKLYYWQIEEILVTRGDLNVQIYTALREMGIELSIPVYGIQNSDENAVTL